MIDWTKVVTREARLQAERDAVFERIRQRRDRAIVSGITVGGVPLYTDEQSQTRVMGAAISAMLDPEYRVTWKGANGTFVTLTAPQVIGIAQAMRAHVQACFDREAAIRTDLEAGRAITIDQGWPDQ